MGDADSVNPAWRRRKGQTLLIWMDRGQPGGGGEDGGEHENNENREFSAYILQVLSSDWPDLLIWMNDVIRVFSNRTCTKSLISIAKMKKKERKSKGTRNT